LASTAQSPKLTRQGGPRAIHIATDADCAGDAAYYGLTVSYEMGETRPSTDLRICELEPLFLLHDIQPLELLVALGEINDLKVQGSMKRRRFKFPCSKSVTAQESPSVITARFPQPDQVARRFE
jgi:hypothetical protein